MARAKRKAARRDWTPAELKELKALAGRAPLARIARQLRRTGLAVRWKATQKGISLALKRR
jgi:hypothetical protein